MGVAKVLSTISGTPCAVRGRGKLFNIQHGQRRVCDRLAVNGLCVGAEGGVQFLSGAVGVDERELNAHALHGNGEEIDSCRRKCVDELTTMVAAAERC